MQSAHTVKAEAALRRAARQYRRLAKEWTTISGVTPSGLDAELMAPPPKGQERAWLERLKNRVSDWMQEWRDRTGEAKERLRERLMGVVRSGRDAAERLLQGNIDPWRTWLDSLSTGAAKEFAGGFGRSLGIGILVVAAAWALSKKG